MVKVAVDDRKLSVFVDPRNRGEWEECVVLDDIPLPEGWAREAHIGVTATTGQLVDNHDIIRCVSASLTLLPCSLYTLFLTVV